LLQALTELVGDDRRFTFRRADGDDCSLTLEKARVGQARVVRFHSNFDIETQVESPPRHLYFEFTESGATAFIRGDGECLGVGLPGRVLALRIPEGVKLNIRANDVRSGVGVPHDRLLEVAARHFGVTPPRSLNFQTSVPLGAQELTELRAVVMAILKTPDHADPSLAAVRTPFEQAIMVALLLGVPSNVSTMLCRAETTLAPAYVRRALDFMHANLLDGITIEEIAAAARCSPRNLQLTFRDAVGATPMRHLRKLRLEEARRRLASGSGEPATAIAARLGYSNVGRFAKDYKLMFGENPSHALRASRMAQAA
jgi:AraC-like DNA-binding protein